MSETAIPDFQIKENGPLRQLTFKLGHALLRLADIPMHIPDQDGGITIDFKHKITTMGKSNT